MTMNHLWSQSICCVPQMLAIAIYKGFTYYQTLWISHRSMCITLNVTKGNTKLTFDRAIWQIYLLKCDLGKLMMMMMMMMMIMMIMVMMMRIMMMIILAKLIVFMSDYWIWTKYGQINSCNLSSVFTRRFIEGANDLRYSIWYALI